MFAPERSPSKRWPSHVHDVVATEMLGIVQPQGGKHVQNPTAAVKGAIERQRNKESLLCSCRDTK